MVDRTHQFSRRLFIHDGEEDVSNQQGHPADPEISEIVSHWYGTFSDLGFSYGITYKCNVGDCTGIFFELRAYGFIGPMWKPLGNLQRLHRAKMEVF